jgi:hypothetical protein
MLRVKQWLMAVFKMRYTRASVSCCVVSMWVLVETEARATAELSTETKYRRQK